MDTSLSVAESHQSRDLITDPSFLRNKSIAPVTCSDHGSFFWTSQEHQSRDLITEPTRVLHQSRALITDPSTEHHKRIASATRNAILARIQSKPKAQRLKTQKLKRTIREEGLSGWRLSTIVSDDSSQEENKIASTCGSFTNKIRVKRSER